MMISLSEISPEFEFVMGRGLVQGPTDYSPEFFGDAVLVMKGRPFSLRFVRDRGQVTVDASRDGTEWIDLRIVFDFLDEKTAQSWDPSQSMTTLAPRLEKEWDRIGQAFGNDGLLSELRIFAESRGEAMRQRFLR